MRLMVDEHAIGWEEAWAITQATCGYIDRGLLPRHLEGEADHCG
jgi:starch phosphorylase